MDNTITWKKFCTQIIKISKDDKIARISMHEVFNRPKNSKTGFPKIQKCKSLSRLNRELVGKNVAELMVYDSYDEEYVVHVRTITPLKDGICLVQIGTLDELIKCIGVDNVVKIYNYTQIIK